MKYLSRLSGNYNLKAFLLITFLGIIFFTSLSIFVYGFIESKQSNIELGESFVLQFQKNTVEKIEEIFDSSQTLCDIVSESFNTEEEVNPKNMIIVGTMQEVLNNKSYLSSLYVATKGSRFLEVRRTNPNECFRSNTEKLLPVEAKFSARFIENTKNGQKEEFYYFNNRNKVIESEVVERVNFNFKEQNWYKEVERTHLSYWSDFYQLNHTKKLGITVSDVVVSDYTDQFVGVVGIDINIDGLSEILQQNKVGSDGSVFIAEEKGELIAHSNPSLVKLDEDNKGKIGLIHNSSDSKLKKAWNAYLEDKKNTLAFEEGGEQFVGVISSFPTVIAKTRGVEDKSFRKNWKIGTIVNENQFVKKVIEIRRKIVGAALILIIISMFLIFYISNSISRPILTLAEEANKIKNFDLTSTAVVKSSIHELVLLNESIVSMRQNIKSFSKFVPKDLVGKLLKHSHEIKIGGKNQLMTLFFSDIANFTSISESYPADKLSAHLSEYFEELTKIIFKYNGNIDKFIGDAVMAFWGAPNKDKDQAINACKAALAVQKRLTDLNRQWASQDKPIFYTRIGIHTGDAVVGNIGSNDRMNYTAIGNTVNLASRLEGTNKFYNTNIIISEDVLNEIGANKCQARPLDIVAVKGKTEGVQIYELLGITTEPSLIASKEQVAFCELFSKAYQFYKESNWDDAIKTLESIRHKFGEDHTVDMYLKRCKDFKKNPPPENWNGINVLKEK